MIKFTIGGQSVDPRNMTDALMSAMLESIRAQITEKIGAIRDPDTGEFPTVIVRGDTADKLTLHVEGSPSLVALVRERLGLDQNDDPEDNERNTVKGSPSVFLSYASEDAALAEKIALAFEGSRIKTWWDKWCIFPGDSLRTKIDQGILGCTHFLVLLTPRSITKPWVNLEIDAGLVRKLSDQCKLLPIRHDLPASSLPPLLSGMHAPTVTTDEDISQLIRDIYDVSRRPPRGTLPASVARSSRAQTGYSSAASTIARLFVERSTNALFADPQFRLEELARETGLSADDTKDALHELSAFFGDSPFHVLVEGGLFSEFDRHWKPWNCADDALRLAADILNDPEFPSDPKQITERYDWEPRRLNPAIYYLLERRLIQDYQTIGTFPFAIARIVGNDAMRRFVKSRC